MALTGQTEVFLSRTSPNITLFTITSIRTGFASNLGLRYEMLATTRHSHVFVKNTTGES